MLGELDEPGGPGEAGRDARAVNTASGPEVPSPDDVFTGADGAGGAGVPDVPEGPAGQAISAASAPEESADRPAGYRDVFGVREFRAVFAADLLSLIGDQVAAVAVAVMLYQDSGSPLLAAAGYATAYVPWLLGGPLLAAWAERFPGRSVMVACDLARALLIAVAALAGFAPLVVAALVFLSAMLAPPFDAARSALLAQILTGNRYPVGMSLRQAVHQIAQLCGFAAGGALVLAISAPGVLALNCLTFLASALLLRAGLVHRAAPNAKGEKLEDAEREDDGQVAFGSGEGNDEGRVVAAEGGQPGTVGGTEKADQSPYRPRRAPVVPVVPGQRLGGKGDQHHQFDEAAAGTWAEPHTARGNAAVPAEDGLHRQAVTRRVPGPRGQGEEDRRWRPADQHPVAPHEAGQHEAGQHPADLHHVGGQDLADQHPIEQPPTGPHRIDEYTADQHVTDQQPAGQRPDGLANPAHLAEDYTSDQQPVRPLADELLSGLGTSGQSPTGRRAAEKRSTDQRPKNRRSDGRQTGRRQGKRRSRRQPELESNEQFQPTGGTTSTRRRVAVRAARFSPSQLRHRGRRAAVARQRRRAQTSSGTSIWSDMIAGAQVVRGDQQIWFPLLLGIVGAAYAIVPEAIAVAYAAELGHSSSAVGLIMAAAAAGSVIGGLAIGRFAAPSTAARLMYPLALVGTLPLLIVALRPGLTISLALFVLCGLGQAFQVVANTQFASHVPAEVRTRAFGIAIAGLYGGQSLAILVAGAAAQWLAPSTVIAGSGLVGALGILLLPGLQHAGSGLRGRHCHR
nr:MFS transporter [Kineosporia rhizophila]